MTMKSRGKTETISNKKVLRDLMLLSIPTIIEQIMSTMMQYVDTAMVGHLGEEATAAVSVTTTVTWLIGSIFSACGTAFLSLCARAYGAGDKARMKKISGLALWITLILGLLVGLLCLALSPFIPVWMQADKSVCPKASGYFFIICLPMVFRAASIILSALLRSVQDSRTPMLVNMTANVLNGILDYLLIYKAGLGVTGAAAATSIAATVGGIWIFLLYAKNPELGLGSKLAGREKKSIKRPGKELHKTNASGQRNTKAENTFLPGEEKVPAEKTAFARKESAQQKRQIMKEILRTGLPVLATSITSCMGYIVFAGLVSGMGTTIFAAHSIAVDAETLFYVPGYGLRIATSALVGAAIGEKNYDKLIRICRISTLVTILMMIFNGLVLFVSAYGLMSIFTNSQAVITLGAQMLKMVALSEPFFGLMIVMEGIFYGSGYTKIPFYIETVSMWGIRILMTAIVVNVWKLELREVWYCMIADNVCKAVILALMAVRFYRNGFNKQEKI